MAYMGLYICSLWEWIQGLVSLVNCILLYCCIRFVLPIDSWLWHLLIPTWSYWGYRNWSCLSVCPSVPPQISLLDKFLYIYIGQVLAISVFDNLYLFILVCLYHVWSPKPSAQISSHLVWWWIRTWEWIPSIQNFEKIICVWKCTFFHTYK